MLNRPDAEQADHPLTLTLTLTQGEPCLIVQITLSPSLSPRRAVRDCQGAKQGMHRRPGAPELRSSLNSSYPHPTLTLTLTQVRKSCAPRSAARRPHPHPHPHSPGAQEALLLAASLSLRSVAPSLARTAHRGRSASGGVGCDGGRGE